MAKVIDFNKYKGLRPKDKRTTSVEDLGNVLCVIIEFLDNEKTSSHYEITGNYESSKMGRAIAAEALLLVAEEILKYDNPEIMTQVMEAFKESLEQFE